MVCNVGHGVNKLPQLQHSKMQNECVHLLSCLEKKLVWVKNYCSWLKMKWSEMDVVADGKMEWSFSRGYTMIAKVEHVYGVEIIPIWLAGASITIYSCSYFVHNFTKIKLRSIMVNLSWPPIEVNALLQHLKQHHWLNEQLPMSVIFVGFVESFKWRSQQHDKIFVLIFCKNGRAKECERGK